MKNDLNRQDAKIAKKKEGKTYFAAARSMCLIGNWLADKMEAD